LRISGRVKAEAPAAAMKLRLEMGVIDAPEAKDD
jgi:hypothetical protein